MTPEACTLTLQSLPLFQGFPAEVMKELASKTTVSKHPKGHMLFQHGDTIQHLHIVTHGWVKVSRLTEEGDEAVLDVLTAPHPLQIMDAIAAPAWGATATVAEDAGFFSLPINLFKATLNEHPHLALGLLQTTAKMHQSLQRELEGRTLQKTDQRVGCFLLRLVPNPGDTHPATLTLPYDKTLLAARLGMQPETFSRALGNLKRELGITIQGHTLTIPNLKSLQAYTCSACSGTYPCIRSTQKA